jgi:hypothetical protein
MDAHSCPALEGLERLMQDAPEKTGEVIERLVMYAKDKHDEQPNVEGQNCDDIESVLDGVLMLASESVEAQAWLMENREIWMWAEDHLNFYAWNSTNQRLKDTLSAMLALAPDLESMPANLLSAYTDENEVFRELRQGGVFYDTKRLWCRECIKSKPNENLANRMEWLRKNEPTLAANNGGKKTIGAGDDDVNGYARHDDLVGDVTHFRHMINGKLFKVTADGDSQMDKIRQYIRWGADLESTHVQNRSYLHQASRFNQPRTVEFLLASGHDPNPTTEGWIPLHNAVNFHGKEGQSFRETIKLLLQGNADPNATINPRQGAYSGKSALDIAVWNPNGVSVLEDMSTQKDIEDILRFYA